VRPAQTGIHEENGGRKVETGFPRREVRTNTADAALRGRLWEESECSWGGNERKRKGRVKCEEKAQYGSGFWGYLREKTSKGL